MRWPALGHNFAALDAGGSLRRILPFVRSGDRFMPSLGVAAALRGADITAGGGRTRGRTLRIRDRLVPLMPVPVKDAITGQTVDQLDDAGQLPGAGSARRMANGRIDASRRGTSSSRRSSCCRATKPTVDPAVFKGKIVFVGLTASGLVDVFQTPFDSRGQGKMPGIQMHASVADSILSNRFITPAATGYADGDDRRAALAVGLLAAFLPFTAAAIGSVVVMVAWTVYAWIRFQERTLGKPDATAGRDGPGALFRHRVSILRRGQEKSGSSRSCSADTYRRTSTTSCSSIRNAPSSEATGATCRCCSPISAGSRA